MMKDFRIEEDSYGKVKIPEDMLWGIQTQRNKEHFNIGRNLIPSIVIKNLILIKKVSAIVNFDKGKLDKTKKKSIVETCDELFLGSYDDHFPLKVYQTGSGTQTNMNVNEVIATMCKESKVNVHPNDDVNMSQSSNDVFPTAMNLSATSMVLNDLIPIMQQWVETLRQLESSNQNVFKIGRTHLQDATPMTFGQEISAWKNMIEKNLVFIAEAIEFTKFIPIGGTAVGTGLNAPLDFDRDVAALLTKELGFEVKIDNKFYGLSTHTPLVHLHGALRCLATDLMKIANDIRWLSSGPRTGIGEITIPSNEAGSSIMPGKVNPTQAEALTMAMCTIFGNDTTIQVANSQGNFQLNVFKPLIIDKVIESIELLTDTMKSFHDYCLIGIKANIGKMQQNIDKSLMTITALTPYFGYDKCTEIAKYALKNDLTVKDAVKSLGYATDEELSEWIKIEKMI